MASTAGPVEADEVPDPSSFQSFDIRRWITLSYWTVLILCLPYWWTSTTIERHALPLDEIAAWQNRGPCPAELTVHLDFSRSISSSRVDGVVKELGALSVQSQQCIAYSAQSTDNHASSYKVVASPRDVAFARLTDVLSVELPLEVAGRLHNTLTARSGAQKTVQYARKYKLVFSLLNEDVARGGVTSWGVHDALSRHIYPVLRSLEDLHDIDIETQIQYYAPLTVDRTMSQDGAIIPEDQLKIFVNSAEWNLASSVSTDPTLHFLLYNAASDKRPLLVQRASSEIIPLKSFTIPEWGGVHVLQAEEGATQVSMKEMSAAFSDFATQLKAFLGLSTAPDVEGAEDGKASWAVHTLMRRRVVENTKDAVRKLSAIARQVNEIQNMRIPKAVQEDVRGSLDALKQVNTPDIRQAMKQSAIAAELATRASFNHEMLAMLYFPDEHKWAVYTPLFGPVAAPMIMALIREIKEYRRQKKLQKLKAKSE